MDELTRNLVSECRRQEESCLYTSTALFEWVKSLRRWRVVFVLVPIILGGVATWPLLKQAPGSEWLTGVCALLAGIAPAIYKALNFDQSLTGITKHANGFKILQDRFRQARLLGGLGPADILKGEFDALMSRMDGVRSTSPIAPERFFKKAQKKIHAGHYDFDADKKSDDLPESP